MATDPHDPDKALEKVTIDLGQFCPPVGVRFDEVHLSVDLADGRVIGAPLTWFPRLVSATQEERQAYELGSHSIHWPALDEDVSLIELLLAKMRVRR